MHICQLEPTTSFGKPLTSISSGFEQDRPSPLVPYLGPKEMTRVACPLAAVVLGWNPDLPRHKGEEVSPLLHRPSRWTLSSLPLGGVQAPPHCRLEDGTCWGLGTGRTGNGWEDEEETML